MFPGDLTRAFDAAIQGVKNIVKAVEVIGQIVGAIGELLKIPGRVIDGLGREFKAVGDVFGDKPVGSPSEACPLAEKRERINKLLAIKGSADQKDADLVAEELMKMPDCAIKKLEENGTKVVVCRNSVTDYLTEMKGVHPRDWPEGMTWDDVPGQYNPERNEVIIATRGHGTPAGAHVPAKGDGHGSQNLVVHETMHGVDLGGKKPLHDDAEFTKGRDADIGTLPAYEKQAANAGLEETYAESAARFYGGDSTDATSHPNLNKYWKTDPTCN